jgi:hypothetical protein
MSRRYELSAFRFSASMAASYTSTIPEVGALISPVEHSPYSVKWSKHDIIPSTQRSGRQKAAQQS